MDVQDRDLVTPLAVAATLDELKILKLLIDAGANVNKTDRYNLTALHYACIRSYGQIACELIRNGSACDLMSRKFLLTPHPLNQLINDKKYCGARNLIESMSPRALAHLKQWILTSISNSNSSSINNKEATKQDDKFHQWLSKYFQQPPTLMSLCRSRIRSRLGGSHLRKKIQMLQLPGYLVNFLIFES